MNIKKFLISLQRLFLNKYSLTCAILLLGVARDPFNRGIFIIYLIIQSIILQRIYIKHLEDRKQKETKMFKDALKEITKEVKTNFDVTINRWINLGDKK